MKFREPGLDSGSFTVWDKEEQRLANNFVLPELEDYAVEGSSAALTDLVQANSRDSLAREVLAIRQLIAKQRVLYHDALKVSIK